MVTALVVASICFATAVNAAYYRSEYLDEDEFMHIEFETLGPNKDMEAYITMPDMLEHSKALLIFNSALECGFTPQLKDFKKLYDKYWNRGLQVLAFPSNDFNQEPNSNQEIHRIMDQEYDIKFPVMTKTVLNGPEQAPLWKFLKDNHLNTDIDVPAWNPLLESGLSIRDIHWNFEKFLVTRSKKNGKLVIRRFSYQEEVGLGSDMDQLLERALNNPNNMFLIKHQPRHHEEAHRRHKRAREKAQKRQSGKKAASSHKEEL